jgi:hypothetical protein
MPEGVRGIGANAPQLIDHALHMMRSSPSTTRCSAFPALITCRSAVTATRRWHQLSIADSGSMPLIV